MAIRRHAVVSVAGLALAVAAALASAQATVARNRVEVGWISREPRLPPPATAEAAARGEGWPEEGAMVRWVGNVINRGSATVNVPFEWRVDGESQSSGSADVPPGRTEITFSWRWRRDRQRIELEVRPPDDASALDNAVAIDSHSLSLGLWAQQGLYDWMAQDGRPGFERFWQAEIEAWNNVLSSAAFPSAPAGALDRIRLDRVEILADGPLPNLNAAFDTDLFWTFPNEPFGNDRRFLHQYAPDSTLATQSIVLHEILHLRGLTDLYAYDLHLAFGGAVDIEENGRPIAGSILMPSLTPGSSPTYYNAPIEGLMGTRVTPLRGQLTEHCVLGLNLRAGQRSPLSFDLFGNRVQPFAFGFPDPSNYVNQVPDQTVLRLVGSSGEPLANARVTYYRDHSPDTYRKVYRAQPDLTASTDAEGTVKFPGELLGALAHSAPPKSQVVIVGIDSGRARGFGFLPVYELNLVRLRGAAVDAPVRVSVRLVPW